jgi:ABC-type uncharacterized transport system substrate-binding protein
MGHKKKIVSQKDMLFVALLGLMFSVTLAGCGTKTAAPQTGKPGSPTASSGSGTASSATTGKKVLLIDSYHEGYAWSDGIVKGEKDTLDAAGIEYKLVRMDTNLNPSEKFKTQAGLTVKQVIDEYKPDVIIGADDNAAAYVWAPYLKDSTIPWVHVGINWDASAYNFNQYVTGMIEVASIPELVTQMKLLAKGDRLGFLSFDQETPRKEALNITKKFNLPMTERFIANFAEWKAAYLALQDSVDMLIIGNNAGITDWNADEAKAFMIENAKIPSGTIYDFMAPFAMITYAKVAPEFGIWGANTAIKILNGADPASIPATNNVEEKTFLNQAFADKLGVTFSADQIKNAEIIK